LALATKTLFSTNPRWPNTDKKSRKSEKPELLTSTEKVIQRRHRFNLTLTIIYNFNQLTIS